MGIFDSITKVFKNKEEKPPFTSDKAEWQYQSCLKEYCKINDKKEDEITEKDEELIWECSGLHISYFLTWLINNDYLNSEESGISEEVINEVKEKKIKTTKFLGSELDYTLTREDISEDIIGFVDDYYDKCFLSDYSNYMEQNGKNLFCCEFSWEDYENIEKILDKAYSKYKNK